MDETVKYVDWHIFWGMPKSDIDSHSRKGHKAFFVVNPKAGDVDLSSIESTIERCFTEDNHTIYRLRSKEDVVQVVRDASRDGFNTVVAVGGDGTASSVASALVGTEIELGIIPTGTANMLARELGIPLGPEDACSLIASSHENVTLDAMDVNGRPYFYQLVSGYSSMVLSTIERKQKKFLGRVIYPFSSLKHMMDIRPYDFSVHVDGVHREFTAMQIIVANAGIMGTPPFRLGKGIKPDDGQLDLIIMKGKSAASYIAAGADMIFGMEEYSRSFEHITGREFIIDGKENIQIKVDGELIGRTPAKVTILPAAVKAIIPINRCKSFPSCDSSAKRSIPRSEFLKRRK